MNHKVIVIGGGMAGLSACVKLLESGVQDFILIEGTDRLGGRINTIPFRKFFFLLSKLISHMKIFNFLLIKKIALSN